MKAAALKFTPGVTLRRNAEQRLRGAPRAGKSPSVKDLRSAMAELHIYEAELEIQNEELIDSRAQIEESQKKYFRHFDLAPVGLIRLNHAGLILEANILGAQMLDVNRALLPAPLPRPCRAQLARRLRTASRIRALFGQNGNVRTATPRRHWSRDFCAHAKRDQPQQAR
jgi:hypothetical protein